MKMILPVTGKWFVLRGGYNKKDSHSWEMLSQRYAFDLIKLDEHGNVNKNNLHVNEDYYSFGQSIFSPCNGEVVDTFNFAKDNSPFKIRYISYIFPLGNYITIKCGTNIYVTMAHLQKKSIKVRVGDKVEIKDIIGCVGNSGYSAYPHVHFQVQDKKWILLSKGLPIYFKNTVLYFNGKPLYSNKIYKNTVVESL